MWKKLMQILTKSTPIEKEKDVMLDHEYDGIRELDNVLPPWWLWLFYITIFIAVVYLIRYHVVGDWSSAKEYQEEMAIAKMEVDKYKKENNLDIDENNVTLKTDEKTLALGEKLFKEKSDCFSCHRKDGGGSVGPNLTDDKWIYGGDIKSVFKTIANGAKSKYGVMPAHKSSLSPTEIQAVASYILVKLKGTNPPNPKVYPGDPE